MNIDKITYKIGEIRRELASKIDGRYYFMTTFKPMSTVVVRHWLRENHVWFEEECKTESSTFQMKMSKKKYHEFDRFLKDASVTYELSVHSHYV